MSIDNSGNIHAAAGIPTGGRFLPKVGAESESVLPSPHRSITLPVSADVDLDSDLWPDLAPYPVGMPEPTITSELEAESNSLSVWVSFGNEPTSYTFARTPEEGYQIQDSNFDEEWPFDSADPHEFEQWGQSVAERLDCAEYAMRSRVLSAPGVENSLMSAVLGSTTAAETKPNRSAAIAELQAADQALSAAKRAVADKHAAAIRATVLEQYASAAVARFEIDPDNDNWLELTAVEDADGNELWATGNPDRAVTRALESIGSSDPLSDSFTISADGVGADLPL